MDSLLLVLTFILGCLVGLLSVEIHRKQKMDQQREIDLHYETLLWRQLGQSKALLDHNKTLLTDNIALTQKCLELKQKHEKMLAVLN